MDEGGLLVATDRSGITTPGFTADDGVLANDSDAEGDTLTAVLVTSPTYATAFILNADGTFTYQHDGSEVTTDSFQYQVTDGNGGKAAS